MSGFAGNGRVLLLAVTLLWFVASLIWSAAVLFALYGLFKNWRNSATSTEDPDLGGLALLAFTLACLGAVGGLIPYGGLPLQLASLAWPYIAVDCERRVVQKGFGGPAGPRRLVAVALWLEVSGLLLLGALLAVLASTAAAATITRSASGDTAYLALGIALAALVPAIVGAVIAVPATRMSELWHAPYSPAPAGQAPTGPSVLPSRAPIPAPLPLLPDAPEHRQ